MQQAISKISGSYWRPGMERRERKDAEIAENRRENFLENAVFTPRPLRLRVLRVSFQRVECGDDGHIRDGF